jgi:hypothetical protein
MSETANTYAYMMMNNISVSSACMPVYARPSQTSSPTSSSTHTLNINVDSSTVSRIDRDIVPLDLKSHAYDQLKLTSPQTKSDKNAIHRSNYNIIQDQLQLKHILAPASIESSTNTNTANSNVNQLYFSFTCTGLIRNTTFVFSVSNLYPYAQTGATSVMKVLT